MSHFYATGEWDRTAKQSKPGRKRPGLRQWFKVTRVRITCVSLPSAPIDPQHTADGTVAFAVIDLHGPAVFLIGQQQVAVDPGVILIQFPHSGNEEENKEYEKDLNIRFDFARDVDRIIHSFAYTRYMDKTQVFSLLSDDRVSRRMIHVQLVSKIARTIGRALNLNEDLIEAMSLGHDVGHVPFGHKGEKCMQIRAEIKSGQNRFRYGSKVSRNIAKLSTSVSLHLNDKRVCLWVKAKERRLHP